MNPAARAAPLCSPYPQRQGARGSNDCILAGKPHKPLLEFDMIDFKTGGIPMRRARALRLVCPPLMVVYGCRTWKFCIDYRFHIIEVER
jgi:hypothetical protein